jgi:hypothetical protein
MSHQATQDFLNWIDQLPEQEKIYALNMHEYVLNKGIKPRKIKRGYVLFEYWFKGNRIMILRENSYRKTPLDIAIPYGLKGRYGDIDSFIVACSDETDSSDLLKYIIDNACYCDSCGGNGSCENWKEFAGVKRKMAVCHYDITKWKAPKAKLNYTNEDLKWLKRLVDVKIKQILQLNQV